jgi:hypothetical protein
MTFFAIARPFLDQSFSSSNSTEILMRQFCVQNFMTIGWAVQELSCKRPAGRTHWPILECNHFLSTQKWEDFCKRNFRKENKFWSKIEFKKEEYFFFLKLFLEKCSIFSVSLSWIKRFVIFGHYQIEQRKILINMKFVFTSQKKNFIWRFVNFFFFL